MESKEKVSNELVKSLVEHIAKMAIPVFISLDLKTHIESMVIDADTKEEYVITINKVSNGDLFKGGEIVFTKKQRDDFANQEVQKVLSEQLPIQESLINSISDFLTEVVEKELIPDNYQSEFFDKLKSDLYKSVELLTKYQK